MFYINQITAVICQLNIYIHLALYLFLASSNSGQKNAASDLLLSDLGPSHIPSLTDLLLHIWQRLLTTHHVKAWNTQAERSEEDSLGRKPT